MSERVFSNIHCMFVWGNKEDSTTIAKISGHFTHEKKKWFQIYTKDSTCNTGDLCSIPGLGRSSGEGNGNPLQYSCLGNPMDRAAWRVTVHGVEKSQTMTGDLACKFCLNFGSVSIKTETSVISKGLSRSQWKQQKVESLSYVPLFATPWTVAY